MDIKVLIRKIAGKIAGVNKVQEQVDTLFYFLNTYVDIQSVPCAEGSLRDLQRCDCALLKIFNKVCERNNLTYWLDYGSLLGAVRHKGFIPWDDDLDVSMPRADFDRAKSILPIELTKYGITVNFPDNNEHSRMGCAYRHYETGIWIDIFPVDFVYSSENNEEEKQNIKHRAMKWGGVFRRKYTRLSKEVVANKRREFIQGEGTCSMMVHGMEFKHTKWIAMEEEKIFPCKKLLFEDDLFCVPAEYLDYLTEEFGKNYMSFPKTGLEHHGDIYGPLRTWASKHNIDMQEIFSELMKIYDVI